MILISGDSDYIQRSWSRHCYRQTEGTVCSTCKSTKPAAVLYILPSTKLGIINVFVLSYQHDVKEILKVNVLEVKVSFIANMKVYYRLASL